MPELKCKALNNVLCRTCDHLDYLRGRKYVCLHAWNLSKDFNEEHFVSHELGVGIILLDKKITECAGYQKRATCNTAPEKADCQFWCLGNHPDAPMERCPYYKVSPRIKI